MVQRIGGLPVVPEIVAGLVGPALPFNGDHRGRCAASLSKAFWSSRLTARRWALMPAPASSGGMS